MKTPICDFVRDYAASGTVRMHMPGHKGSGTGTTGEVDAGGSAEGSASEAPDQYSRDFSNIAAYDITEIKGSDELYHPTSIIAESEKNASTIFGCPTYYSTEGSSLCIRAMLYLNMMRAKHIQSETGSDKSTQKPWVLAARNVHEYPLILALAGSFAKSSSPGLCLHPPAKVLCFRHYTIFAPCFARFPM